MKKKRQFECWKCEKLFIIKGEATIHSKDVKEEDEMASLCDNCFNETKDIVKALGLGDMFINI